MPLQFLKNPNILYYGYIRLYENVNLYIQLSVELKIHQFLNKSGENNFGISGGTIIWRPFQNLDLYRQLYARIIPSYWEHKDHKTNQETIKLSVQLYGGYNYYELKTPSLR